MISRTLGVQTSPDLDYPNPSTHSKECSCIVLPWFWVYPRMDPQYTDSEILQLRCEDAFRENMAPAQRVCAFWKAMGYNRSLFSDDTVLDNKWLHIIWDQERLKSRDLNDVRIEDLIEEALQH